jgi:uncharacterized membrane protein SpoIIM required for sporulation
MKETAFIDQNKDKWQRFEKLSESQTRDPEELSDLYLDITDDLSYAQTFYKRRTVRVYLNQLAQRVYTGLHIQRGEPFKKLLSVWQTSLPIEIYKARKTLLFTLVVFLIWTAIGAISTHFNPDFAKVVMGDQYVTMTNQNIAKGDPLAVYGLTQSQLSMFISITTNNLRVAFYAFIFGAFFTIGTHIILFQNGIMLGAFQYYFATKGLLITSFLGIWIHGAFEISAIVLSAGAGITLGTGLLFPGSYTRLQSLQLSAKRGLKIMLSLVPFIIMAGWLESYVTRNYQDFPDWSKWTLIALSFGIIFVYYVVYPIIVARKNPHLLEEEEVVNFFPPNNFDLNVIRSFGQMIADSFQFFSKNFSFIFRLNMLILFPLMFLLAVLQGFQHAEWMQQQHFYDWSKQLEIMMGFGFHSIQDIVVCFCWTLLISGLFINVLAALKLPVSEKNARGIFQFYKKHFLIVWFSNFIFLTVIAVAPWQAYFILIFLFPFVYLKGIVPLFVEGKFGQKLGKGWAYSTSSYGYSLLSILIFSLMFVLFLQPIAFVGSIYDDFDASNPFSMGEPPIRDLLDMLADFVKRIADVMGADRMYWSNLVRQLVYILFLLAVLPLWIVSLVFLTATEHEKRTATGLKKAFENFGKRKRFKESEADFE